MLGCLAGIHSGGRGGNEKREAPRRGEDEKRTDRFPGRFPRHWTPAQARLSSPRCDNNVSLPIFFS